MKSTYYYSLILTAFLFICASPVIAQEVNQQGGATESTQPAKTLKIKVSGITCSGDCKDIQKAVSKLNGVISARHIGKASATSAFEVKFNPRVVSEKEIRAVVENTPGCEDPDDRPYKVKQ